MPVPRFPSRRVRPPPWRHAVKRRSTTSGHSDCGPSEAHLDAIQASPGGFPGLAQTVKTEPAAIEPAFRPAIAVTLSHGRGRPPYGRLRRLQRTTDEQERRVRRLLLGKGAVLAHRFDQPLAAEMDESEQRSTRGARTWWLLLSTMRASPLVRAHARSGRGSTARPRPAPTTATAAVSEGVLPAGRALAARPLRQSALFRRGRSLAQAKQAPRRACRALRDWRRRHRDIRAATDPGCRLWLRVVDFARPRSS